MLTSLRSLLLAIASLTLTVAHSEPAASSDSVTYWHLVADSDGGSRFIEKKLDLAPFAKQGVLNHAIDGKGPPMIVRFKSGTVEDWHNAPTTIYFFVIQGSMEIVSSDGKTRIFNAGDVALMDDLTGKGHWNRAIGPTDFTALVIPVGNLPMPGK